MLCFKIFSFRFLLFFLNSNLKQLFSFSDNEKFKDLITHMSISSERTSKKFKQIKHKTTHNTIFFVSRVQFYRLSHDCHFDIDRDVSNAHCRSSSTLRAEATFSRYELACEKQSLPTTVQFSIVHAKNSSRDSQTTGSSNLREFHWNQIWENCLRTTLLELLFCFSAFSPSGFKYFSRKISSDRLFKESIVLPTVNGKSCLLCGEHI